MKLVDFQVGASPMEAASAEVRRINHALFVVYYPIRLWLRDQKATAPFRKIIVTLLDGNAAARWHGAVGNVLSLCVVTEAVEPSAPAHRSSDPSWVLGIVLHALSRIREETGWHSPELERHVAALVEAPLPFVHFFDRLARIDRKTGSRCVPWFSIRVGECRVGVRIGDRDVIVLSAPEPIFLEDDFDFRKLAIRGRDVVLLDGRNVALATVPIDG
jgi:hypothetical protein